MEAGGVGAVHLLTGRLLMSETLNASKLIAYNVLLLASFRSSHQTKFGIMNRFRRFERDPRR